jgi:tRNA-2-methylthio-N6-dimethylallyladenosine synthase
MVTVEVTYGAPHHLLAEKAPLAVRRTRAGDAWERRTAAPVEPAGVMLGLPTIGAPAAPAGPVPAGGCSLG